MSKFIEVKIRVQKPNEQAKQQDCWVNIDQISSVYVDANSASWVSMSNGKDYQLFNGHQDLVKLLPK